MPINVPNDQYKNTIEQVTRVRDCASGLDAVKSRATAYLPQLSGQTTEEYNAYLSRAYLIPVVKATATALTGAIMRKDPVITAKDRRIIGLLDDVDGEGRDIQSVTSECISELLLAGRVGLLVEPKDSRLTIKLYSRESIINWSSDYIVLQQEFITYDEKDKFKQITQQEFIELTISDGVYVQNVWRKGLRSEYEIVDQIIPTVNGKPLDYIPFVFANALDATDKLTPPVLLPLADVNLDQYRLSTDLRHGLHWTALPTLFLFGDITDETGVRRAIKVGAGSSNHIPDSDARAMLLEFTGAGLGAIKQTIDEDRETMASIGARLLSQKSNVQKTAETARIELSGETATLSTIANAIENAFNIVFDIIVDWLDSTDDVTYQINKDFVDDKLSPQELTAYLQAYTTNAISLETFLSLLKRGEILPDDVTPEDEVMRISEGGDYNK